jgi:hypothetical protein
MTYPVGQFFHDENMAMQAVQGPIDQSTDASMNLTMQNDYMVDTGATDRGHRLAIMDDNMREVGIGVEFGTFKNPDDGKILNAINQTEDFGVHGNDIFITGAVYNDRNGDHFYGLGEAVAGVSVTVTAAGKSTGTDATGSGGGYTAKEDGGAYTVTFTGGGLATAVSANVDGGTRNVKVDLVNGTEIDSNVNTILGAGAKDLRLLGMDSVNATGNSGNNVMTGNSGNNILTGGAGLDTAVFSGQQSDYQITFNTIDGSVTLKDLRAGSPDGTDIVKADVEQVNFAGTIIATSMFNTAPTPPPTASAGSIRIDDVTVHEGDGGTTTALFHVARTDGTAAFDLHYQTKAGTASSQDGDYVGTSGTLHFDKDQAVATIAIAVKGDTIFEATENFQVFLSNATIGGKIVDDTGIGTIIDNDKAPSVSIADSSVVEGDSGTRLMNFTVRRSDGNGPFDVHYTTKAGTTSSDAGDYAGTGGTVHFDADQTTATISVAVNGDTKIEGNETFKVVLSDATNGAKIVDGTAVGTIIDNDNHAHQDFNGDANSDVLLHNSNGSVQIWEMNGLSKLTTATVGTQATSWHAIDSFDFNGDGKADILWQNDNGQVQLWKMDGADAHTTTNLGSMTSSWHIGAVDDFNGNGKGDVLWVNTSGQVKVELDGAQASASQTVDKTVAAGWAVKDAFDFTGDGKADVLLMKGNAVEMWQMDGNHVVKSTDFGSIGAGFHFAGAADFNGDGKGDILWHNDATGQLVLWEMNGASIKSNTSVGFATKGYEVADIGDYNHDSHADILLQNAAGAVVEWQMNGDQILARHDMGTISIDWHMH